MFASLAESMEGSTGGTDETGPGGRVCAAETGAAPPAKSICPSHALSSDAPHLEGGDVPLAAISMGLLVGSCPS